MKLQGQVAVSWSYPPESSGRMAVKIEKLLYVLIGVRFRLHLFPAFIGLLAGSTLGVPKRGAFDRDRMAELPDAAQEGINHLRITEEVGPLLVR